MDPRPCLASLLIAATCLHTHAQNTFNLGMKVGLGGSVLPLHATLDSKNYNGGVRPMTIFTTGILAQYMINDQMGIESGTHLTHYGYYKNETSAWQNLTGEEPIVQVISCQVPVVILYRINMPNPFKYMMLDAGTTVDLISADRLFTFGKVVSTENLYCGVRLGREKVRGSRIEFGLEFQYAFKRFYVEYTNYNHGEERFSTRLSLLALNFYYFFWNQPLTKVKP